MFYGNEYTEAAWRSEADAAEREERDREARDLAEYYCAGDSPAYLAFLESTTPDAPGGAYEPRPARIEAHEVTTKRKEEAA